MILPRIPETLRDALLIFSAFALLIAAGRRWRKSRLERVWTMFAVQVVTTSWIVVPAWLGGWWIRGVLTVTAILGARELLGVLARSRPAPAALPVVLATGLTCVAATLPEATWFLSVPVLLFIALLMLPVCGATIEGAYTRACLGLGACLYPGVCAAFGVRLADLGNGFGDVLFLYAVAELNDACAFLVGRLIGSSRHVSRLSPKKTLAGSVGGLVAATLAGTLLAFLLPDLDRRTCTALGLAIGVAGQIADLAASAIKRGAGVKDFADTVPTQGGVLDVYDAFILLLPPWYFTLRMIRF